MPVPPHLQPVRNRIVELVDSGVGLTPDLVRNLLADQPDMLEETVLSVIWALIDEGGLLFDDEELLRLPEEVVDDPGTFRIE